MTRLSSPRSFIIATGAIAAIVALIAAALLLPDSGGDDSDTAIATATQAATSPAGALSTPTSVPPESPFRVTDAGLVRRDLAPGEVPTEEHGIIFHNLETSAAELWTFASEEEVHIIYYRVDPTHRWLSASPLLITDRITGRSIEQDSSGWALLAGPTPHGLVVMASTGPFSRFLLVDLATDPTEVAAVFDLPFGWQGTQAVFLADGARVLFVSRDPPGDETIQVFVADPATGEVSDSGPIGSFGALDLLPLPDGGALLTVAQGDKDSDPGVSVTRFDPQGQITSGWRSDRLGSAFIQGTQVSPDGRWLVWQERLALGIPLGAGGVEHWPVLVFSDIDAQQVVFRAVRASLTNGIQQLGWLPDSSAVVVATQDGFALLGVDQTITPLPFGPVDHFEPIPIPAPNDPAVFLYDGNIVDSGGNVIADLPYEAWFDDTPVQFAPYQWDDTGSEVRITRAIPGGGDFGPGSIAKYGLPLKIETPPFPETTRLRVETGGDTLNVRRVAGVAGEVLGQLQNETSMTVSGDHTDHCGIATGCSVEADPDSEYDTVWWLYVRADDGLEGWARSDFLAWAD